MIAEQMGFYSDEELAAIGLAFVGKNVRLSRCASIYGAGRIWIGDNSRIDDFCVLSAGEGGIYIGRHVHIAVHASVMGQAQIILEDFVGVSGRVSIYSSSDDFSGEFMTGPTVPAEFTNVMSKPVRIGRHVIVGAGSVILPGTTCEEGSAIGALSLVKGCVEKSSIYVGVPARRVSARRTELFQIEKRLI